MLRKAEIKDIPEILDILNESILNDTARFDEEPYSLAEMTKWYEEHSQGKPVLVEEIDGTVAGWGCVTEFSKKSAYRYTVENSVYVHKHYRGRGIGKTLLKALIKQCKEANYHTILSLITSDNQQSIALHKSCGFKEVGEMGEVGYKFEEWLNVVIMQLIIE